MRLTTGEIWKADIDMLTPEWTCRPWQS